MKFEFSALVTGTIKVPDVNKTHPKEHQFDRAKEELTHRFKLVEDALDATITFRRLISKTQ